MCKDNGGIQKNVWAYLLHYYLHRMWLRTLMSLHDEERQFIEAWMFTLLSTHEWLFYNKNTAPTSGPTCTLQQFNISWLTETRNIPENAKAIRFPFNGCHVRMAPGKAKQTRDHMIGTPEVNCYWQLAVDLLKMDVAAGEAIVFRVVL